MPSIHNTPTINDYVAAMTTRSEIRTIEFDEDGLTARVVISEIGLHYVEMFIDAETGILTDEFDICDFSDCDRVAIVSTFADVAAFIKFLEE